LPLESSISRAFTSAISNLIVSLLFYQNQSAFSVAPIAQESIIVMNAPGHALLESSELPHLERAFLTHTKEYLLFRGPGVNQE
jgi:hypothetical protein